MFWQTVQYIILKIMLFLQRFPTLDSPFVSRNLQVRPLPKLAQTSIHLQIILFTTLNDPLHYTLSSFETGVHVCHNYYFISRTQHRRPDEIILKQPGTSWLTISHATSGIHFSIIIYSVCRKASIWRSRTFLAHEASLFTAQQFQPESSQHGGCSPTLRNYLSWHGSSRQVLPRKQETSP